MINSNTTKAFSIGFLAVLAVGLGPLQAFAAKDLRMPCMDAAGAEAPGDRLWGECGFPDSSDFRASSLSALTVHFQNYGSTNQTASAKACITYFNAVGGACDSASSTTVGAGSVGSVNPSRSLWTSGNTAHFKTVFSGTPSYVQVQGIFAYIP